LNNELSMCTEQYWYFGDLFEPYFSLHILITFSTVKYCNLSLSLNKIDIFTLCYFHSENNKSVIINFHSKNNKTDCDMFFLLWRYAA
jgi:hypothetical protein